MQNRLKATVTHFETSIKSCNSQDHRNFLASKKFKGFLHIRDLSERRNSVWYGVNSCFANVPRLQCPTNLQGLFALHDIDGNRSILFQCLCKCSPYGRFLRWRCCWPSMFHLCLPVDFLCCWSCSDDKFKAELLDGPLELRLPFRVCYHVSGDHRTLNQFHWDRPK